MELITFLVLLAVAFILLALFLNQKNPFFGIATGFLVLIAAIGMLATGLTSTVATTGFSYTTASNCTTLSSINNTYCTFNQTTVGTATTALNVSLPSPYSIAFGISLVLFAIYLMFRAAVMFQQKEVETEKKNV